ncbi:MAG: LamB/YcsF family protein [Pelagibacteraceae bacterium]|nr:LamB/YcsF family protein [Pelagibacteraceae bacterium]MBO6492806.1 LamB/YcsF family protein [Pelagibacteraceae bacterium]
MEVNINCDLGESSKFCSTENDPLLLKIVNSANIACGYHAGDKQTMEKTIKISKENGVSIGAHPSFNDPENFGRKRLNLPSGEISKLIIDQINILSNIATNSGTKVTHVKPHGALNNMACEDYELAKIISESIIQVNKDLIFLVPTGSQMEKVGKKLGMKTATEIFADRNYEDDGNLVSRSKNNAMITDPEVAKKHVIKMIENQGLNCYSGKQIPCEIDSICVHGDGKSAVSTAKEIKEGLIKSGIILKPLNKLKKFI